MLLESHTDILKSFATYYYIATPSRRESYRLTKYLTDLKALYYFLTVQRYNSFLNMQIF
nr:MAG TPA: hypothetical protein [Caudoviricetes sp.]